MACHKSNMADTNTPLISSPRSRAISTRGFVVEQISFPAGVCNQRSNDSWDYWFLPELKHQREVMWGAAAWHWPHWFPNTLAPYSGWIFTRWIWIITRSGHKRKKKKKKEHPKKHSVFFVTWSWWSKKVLIHALEPASHTFTLLSDELRVAEERQHFNMFHSSSRCQSFVMSGWSRQFILAARAGKLLLKNNLSW